MTLSVDKILNLKRLTATAKGASWGAIGGATAILMSELARKQVPSFPLPDLRLTAAIGTAFGGGAYGVLTASSWSVRRCLLKSQAMFVDGLVTRNQFSAMRNNCLKRWS